MKKPSILSTELLSSGAAKRYVNRWFLFCKFIVRCLWHGYFL